MTKSTVANQRRAGVSLLELQMAFVVFGIALAGSAPLVVMQLKQFHKLEQRFSDNTTYYLVPTNDSWARKLGAAATISSIAPGPIEPPPAVTVVNNVHILSFDKAFAGEDVTVQVTVTGVP